MFEQLATEVGAAAAVRTFPEVLAERTAAAAGLKSVVAYRFGFDFAPEPPTPAGGRRRGRSDAGDRPGRGARASPTRPCCASCSGAVWTAGCRCSCTAATATPTSTCTDATRCCSPGFLRLVEPRGVDVLLLHCYPYHRHAGYLAQVFPHVYFDVGLAVNHTGLGSTAVVAESLELAPFAKILFSSDAYGPAELHYLGAHLWRRGLARVLGDWVDEGAATTADAARIARMIGRDNALRVYGVLTRARLRRRSRRPILRGDRRDRRGRRRTPRKGLQAPWWPPTTATASAVCRRPGTSGCRRPTSP